MKHGWLMLAGLMLGAAPASAADHTSAVANAFSRSPSDDAAAAVIARAKAAIGRPPVPLATIHVEGTLPGRGIHDASQRALHDLPIAHDLALAWKLSGQKPYLKAVEQYLSAWASIYQPSFNPIDETGFDDLILAYGLTKTRLSIATRRSVDGLLRRLAVGYLDRMETGKVVPPQTLTNNWQSHRVKLVALAAFQLGDAALINRARTAYQKQVGANLRPDGSAMDFAMRDALHYVVYTLEPLAIAAYAAKIHGQDWYGYSAADGAGLRKSLDWLAVYARGEKTHIEFARSVVPFDRERREAGGAGFQNEPWDRTEATVLYAIASLLDPQLNTLRDVLPAPASNSPAAARRDAWLLSARLGSGDARLRSTAGT